MIKLKCVLSRHPLLNTLHGRQLISEEYTIAELLDLGGETGREGGRLARLLVNHAAHPLCVTVCALARVCMCVSVSVCVCVCILFSWFFSDFIGLLVGWSDGCVAD